MQTTRFEQIKWMDKLKYLREWIELYKTEATRNWPPSKNESLNLATKEERQKSLKKYLHTRKW